MSFVMNFTSGVFASKSLLINLPSAYIVNHIALQSPNL